MADISHHASYRGEDRGRAARFRVSHAAAAAEKAPRTAPEAGGRHPAPAAERPRAVSAPRDAAGAPSCVAAAQPADLARPREIATRRLRAVASAPHPVLRTLQPYAPRRCDP